MSNSTEPVPAGRSGGWSDRSDARWRSFLRTETGSAALLVAAVAVALAWANIDLHSYERVWETHLSVGFGAHEVALNLREWVNSGLMSFFFLVVGMEARREFDVGELRDRRRVMLSVLAGTSSMLVPALIFVAFNAGQDTVHGWGAATSTDTAFALGILTLLRRRLPGALRPFLLSISVVDDLAALVIIATVYSDTVRLPALLVALGALVAMAVLRWAGIRHGGPSFLLALVVWVALLEAGIDPVITGLVVGVLMIAYPARRGDLERASGLFRAFREQPTPQLERSARQGLAAVISPNEHLEQLYLPWTSYVIVPVFALANAGITLGAADLERAFTSPVTWGIVVGCLVGKPLGVLVPFAVAFRLSGGRLRPVVGWGSVAAGGTIAGAAFTVSLLIAAKAFEGEALQNATIGILTTLLVAFVAAFAVTVLLRLLPPRRRARALLGTVAPPVDLAVPVNAGHDRVRGSERAPVTLVEYGDYQCPYCGQAEEVVREVLAGFGDDIRYVWRHLPLTDVHPLAWGAARAAEAAGEQGMFWQMHDLLMRRQEALAWPDLMSYARELDLDQEAFAAHVQRHSGDRRITEDVDSADLSSVSGTPTFFVNGRRHHGAYDADALSQAIRLARKRALLAADDDL